MSLARSSSPGGGRITLILAFVFPAMIAAALALGYSGYQWAQNIVFISQLNFQKTAEARAKGVAEQVQVALDEAVNGFFTDLQTVLNDPLATEAERCAVPTPPLVERYVILSERPGAQVPLCAGPNTARARLTNAMRTELDTEVRNNRQLFEWDTRFAGLKYVHLGDDPGRLFAATRFQAPIDPTAPLVQTSPTYLLVARLDMVEVRSKVLRPILNKLGDTYRVAAVDKQGKVLGDLVIGGSEPMRDERLVWEGQFGRHLHAWRLRLAPEEEYKRELQASLEWQRVIQPLFVVLSTVIMAVGMGIVVLSVVAERRASRLKSDFIANVSHELKTPLSLIRMFGELVATGRHKGEDTAREYGSIITRESERLSHLIDNVLDFARLERGKASYDFAENDLALVLERALDVSRYRLEKERIKLRTRVEHELPAVRMDENAVTLVILNLIDNAIKYGAEGGSIDVALDRAPGGVVLSVRDFGPGIPREEQGRIFDRFYRAQSARDRNVRGSGIGLSLVRHIAEAHGGWVTVESPVGSPTGPEPGSVFRVFLPAPIVERPAAVPGPGGIMPGATGAPSRAAAKP